MKSEQIKEITEKATEQLIAALQQGHCAALQVISAGHLPGRRVDRTRMVRLAWFQAWHRVEFVLNWARTRRSSSVSCGMQKRT